MRLRGTDDGAGPPKFRIAVGTNWGAVCDCPGGKCVDPPTETEPVCLEDLPCPACGGNEEKAPDCGTCQGHGFQLLTRCPYAEVPPDVWDMVDLCEFADKGNLPVSGGVLDQTASFLACLRFVRADTVYFRAQAAKKNKKQPADG